MKIYIGVFAILSTVQGQADGADWQPCTKQNCLSEGWICCDTTSQDAQAGTADTTGVMLCIDPDLKGIVPNSSTDYAGMTYHCSHQQHKDFLVVNATGASTLIFKASAAALSAIYMMTA